MRLPLLIVLAVTSSAALCQPRLELSEKHRARIDDQVNAVKKRTLYLKYFRRDSLRIVKETEKFWAAKWDSAHGKVRKKKQQVQEWQEKLISNVTQSLTALQPDFVVPGSLYKMPPAIESTFRPLHLETTYSVAREFITKAISDTTKDLLNIRQPLQEISKLEQLDLNNVKSEIQSIAGKDNPVSKSLNDLGNLSGSLVNDKIKDQQFYGEFSNIKEQVGDYSGTLKQAQGYMNLTPDSLTTLATARLEREAQTYLMTLAGVQSYQSQLNEFNQLRSQYAGQLNQLNDTTARREFLKQQAEDMAMKYIQDNPTLLKGLQPKLDLLMKKYSAVSNSNDLSSAVKRSSLKGRTFRERLIVAANFQLLSLDPVSLDFSPQVGYRFNNRFSAGVGGTYRQTFTDTNVTFSPDVLGYKGFLSFDVIQSFFAYGEYAQNSPGMNITSESAVRIWKPAALAGIGKRFSVHKKVDMTVMALYNFLHESGDTIYPKPFIIRFGFQLSELALLKQKVPIKYFNK